MIQSLENFCPRLRPGRMIPQGSKIIFETEDPYNQIILPVHLADLILLCSGRFSVRQIVEKIYKKQGSVPFKSILRAIHTLHLNGFFENGDELLLNSHLQSWMDPKKNRISFSWRFGQRILADRPSPTGFYIFTLLILIGGIFGLSLIPGSLLHSIDEWFRSIDLVTAFLRLFVASSVLQTVRYLAKGVQLLLLTGKAYNVSLRLSPWGLHLHIGDEANDLFENRLYTSMFHISQMLITWSTLFVVHDILPNEWVAPSLLMCWVSLIWELNPFVKSEGLKLVQSLMLPEDHGLVSWRFESTNLIETLRTDDLHRDRDFARICTIWGGVFLVGGLAFLHELAISFGPFILDAVRNLNVASIDPLIGLTIWLISLYLLIQTFVESIVFSVTRPWLKMAHQRIAAVRRRHREPTRPEELVQKIQDLPLFSHFQNHHLLRIVADSQYLLFQKGSYILRQGDQAHEIYVLLEGEIEITRHSGSVNEWISEMGAVSIFGEAALLDASPRSAQVIAKSDVWVLRVPVASIRKMAEESHVIRQLDDFRNAILVNQFFASSPVFRSLSTSSIEFLCSRGTLEYYDQNQVVFQQGDLGDSIYLVLRGQVEVEVHGVRIKAIRQGSFFGEIALIANIPRTATIHTLEPCVFFKISADAFWEILVQHMDLGVFIETVSENRLKEDLELSPIRLKPTGSDSL